MAISTYESWSNYQHRKARAYFNEQKRRRKIPQTARITWTTDEPFGIRLAWVSKRKMGEIMISMEFPHFNEVSNGKE